MKLLIVTTDRTLLSWKSLPKKKAAILKGLNLCKNGSWEIEIREDITLQPLVVAGRISHLWYDKYSTSLFQSGYQHIFIHFSMARWKSLGLDSTLRGANQIDHDYVGECYGRADETTLRGKTKQNQFIQTVLHELSHELARSTAVPDNTHPYHALHPDISPLFATYDLDRWQPAYKEELTKRISVLAQMLALLTPKPVMMLVHPVQDYRKYVSQGYGVSDSSYKLTGRHIGTDYAVPVNSPLYAPYSGEVTAAGRHAELGNYCHYQYSFQGETFEERWCHLSAVPKLGTYKRGERVALSGDTGRSTGPHLHREVWRGDVRVDLINKKNWAQLTCDPESLTY